MQAASEGIAPHHTIGFPNGETLTIPAKRPIKPVYVMRFISMLDSTT